MKYIFILFILLSASPIHSRNSFRIMFYNVENLFDFEHIEGKEDKEFTPEGEKKWTPGKYFHKLNRIAKVITAVREWEDLGLIGLCEVQNEKVIKDLVRATPLKKDNYQYFITDSPDNRGINVALLYQRDIFKLFSANPISIPFRNKKEKTRDLLHVSGLLQSGDTLDVFVCHFPSRSGGEKATEGKRNFVASILKRNVDSLMFHRVNPKILMMGDFNDFPDNNSIYHVLKARPIDFSENMENEKELYNLFYEHMKKGNGTYKYKGKWNMLDQIIVSGSLLNTYHKVHIKEETATIYKADFLLQNDNSDQGKKPFRSYLGNKYMGGYSDHLPIYVDINYK
ncbi:MAG: endonuclease [Candidatus Azobacteroides sp.]|nr:endonuclease [Candidatus Azobacteroides sp.]